MAHFVIPVNNTQINFARNDRSTVYEIKNIKFNKTMRYVANNEINDESFMVEETIF